MNTPKYKPPQDPAVAVWASGLDADAREFFEERAAIREFDGMQSRRSAEADAKDDTERFLARRNPPQATPLQTRKKIQK